MIRIFHNKEKFFKNILLSISLLTLTACQEAPESPKNSKNSPATLDNNINSNAINLGRHSALTRQLAKKWQLSDIDGRLIDSGRTIIFDLTLLEKNTATLSLGKDCQAIHITLDTQNLVKGELQVREIKRKLDKCSTALEDNLMAMIGDIKSFNQNNLTNNILTLNSFQNKLNFRPYEP